MIPKSVTRFFPIILLIFHLVGLYLFLKTKDGADLTWANLLLCSALVLLTEGNLRSAIYIFLFISIGGYIIELIGIKTGYLFGEYEYQTVLGWKLFDVSIIIGINWYAIVLASANIARFVKTLAIGRALLAGFICVFMDFVIEPIAIKFDFWQWEGNVIPVFNYVTWFVFATLFAYIYLKTSPKSNNTAAWLYVIWIGFFGLLNVFL